MDPVTSLILGEATSQLVGKLRKKVVEKWTNHRGDRFFQFFIEEVKKELGGEYSNILDSQIKKITDKENMSALIFDKYRDTFFSKSRDIGPALMGLLTARIVLGEREPNFEEEAIMELAQKLNDDQILEIRTFISAQIDKANGPSNEDVTLSESSLFILWHTEQIDLNWQRDREIDVSPMNLSENFGPWAGMMERLGVLVQKVTDKSWDYQADSDRHIDEDGTIREIKTTLTIPAGFIIICELVDRITKAIS